MNLAVVSALLTALVLNPLSAGLLDVEQVNIAHTQSFLTIKPPVTTPQLSSIDDSSYIISVAALVYNISTSAWVSDIYAVMPFWPKDLQSTAPSLTFGNQPSAQSWSGTTDVFQVQLNCTPFTSIYEYDNTTSLENRGFVTLNPNTTCAVTPDVFGNIVSVNGTGGVWNTYTVC